MATIGFMLAVSFIACKKNDAPVNNSLEATKKSAILKGEPVVFTMPQATGNTVNWSVNPSANTQLSTSGNKASILFASKGTYVVTAVSGNNTTSTSVSVLDSIYDGSNVTSPAILPFVSNETIKITVSKIDSGAISGLLLSSITNNAYQGLGNSLVSTFTPGTKSFGINFQKVSLMAGYSNGASKAGGFHFFYPIADGSNTLTINFNGTTYTGTIVKNGNAYSINWNYSSGITISPTSL